MLTRSEHLVVGSLSVSGLLRLSSCLLGLLFCVPSLIIDLLLSIVLDLLDCLFGLLFCLFDILRGLLLRFLLGSHVINFLLFSFVLFCLSLGVIGSFLSQSGFLRNVNCWICSASSSGCRRARSSATHSGCRRAIASGCRRSSASGTHSGCRRANACRTGCGSGLVQHVALELLKDPANITGVTRCGLDCTIGGFCHRYLAGISRSSCVLWRSTKS